MNVILMEPMRNLGDLGEEVSVKNGFARNFLIPQGMAVRATKTNRAEFEARREELERIAKERLQGAEGRAARLEGVEITIAARASEEGRLYGSIGTREIADAMIAAGHDINKAEVLLPDGALRQIGEYSIAIAVHTEISVEISLAIISE